MNGMNNGNGVNGNNGTATRNATNATSATRNATNATRNSTGNPAGHPTASFPAGVCGLDGHTVDCLEKVWQWMTGKIVDMPECVLHFATFSGNTLDVSDPETIFNDLIPGCVDLFG